MSVKKKNSLQNLEKHRYQGNHIIEKFVEGNHLLVKCLQPILAILKEENYKEKICPFTDQIALNLDKVEILCKKGTIREKTVDFVVGLEKDWLLLVEVKLDVENMDNIVKCIKEKIEHSKVVLQSCENYIHCENSVVVLLNNNRFQERSNRLRRSLISINPHIKPYRVCDFYQQYFDKKP